MIIFSSREPNQGSVQYELKAEKKDITQRQICANRVKEIFYYFRLTTVLGKNWLDPMGSDSDNGGATVTE